MRERAQTIDAARGEDQVRAFTRELASEGRTDAGGRARDEDDRVGKTNG